MISTLWVNRTEGLNAPQPDPDDPEFEGARRSPYLQRHLELGDSVMVTRDLDSRFASQNGYVGRIVEYDNADGFYFVDDLAGAIHQSQLFEFDWEWSYS